MGSWADLQCDRACTEFIVGGGERVAARGALAGWARERDYVSARLDSGSGRAETGVANEDLAVEAADRGRRAYRVCERI
jgi:hypothetical protein